jgi:hypothetical protein
MLLTPDERPVVRRAITAYLKAKSPHKGQFVGPTADEILEELAPTPVRWAELAALVIATAEDSTEDGRRAQIPRDLLEPGDQGYGPN